MCADGIKNCLVFSAPKNGDMVINSFPSFTLPGSSRISGTPQYLLFTLWHLIRYRQHSHLPWRTLPFGLVADKCLEDLFHFGPEHIVSIFPKPKRRCRLQNINVQNAFCNLFLSLISLVSFVFTLWFWLLGFGPYVCFSYRFGLSFDLYCGYTSVCVCCYLNKVSNLL